MVEETPDEVQVITANTTAEARDGVPIESKSEPEQTFEDEITSHDLADEDNEANVRSMIAAMSPERAVELLAEFGIRVDVASDELKKTRRLHTLLIPRATARPRPSLVDMNKAARKANHREDQARIETTHELNKVLRRQRGGKSQRGPMFDVSTEKAD